MTKEELKEALKTEIRLAKWVDSSYADCVPIEVLEEALEALSAEPQDSADRERVIALRVNNKTCVQCKYYECFDKKAFPCIDCMLDCKDRFEPKPAEPQEWISVKDRLPEEHKAEEAEERCLVTYTYTDCKGNHVCIGIDLYKDGKWWFHSEDEYEHVTAWMPLPSPYKGE